MQEAVRQFFSQFAYEPAVEGGELPVRGQFAVSGMGGSHLAADVLKDAYPELDVLMHRDYGLPPLPEEARRARLFIFSSYSGNTEEVLDGMREAHERGFAFAAVATGGKLIAQAREYGVPYVAMPDTGIQPRAALGYSFRALAKLMGQDAALAESASLAALKADAFRPIGAALAGTLKGFVPVIYASNRNASVAYNWKIKLNETAKIPAFYNLLPEMNHNEMTGFDAVPATKELSGKFYFVFLTDEEDHPQVRKRMEVMARLYGERGFPAYAFQLSGASRLGKIFSALSVADWVAVHLAEGYGVDPEQVPMVEEFKRLIAG